MGDGSEICVSHISQVISLQQFITRRANSLRLLRFQETQRLIHASREIEQSWKCHYGIKLASSQIGSKLAMPKWHRAGLALCSSRIKRSVNLFVTADKKGFLSPPLR
jgi:hypothetical protein